MRKEIVIEDDWSGLPCDRIEDPSTPRRKDVEINYAKPKKEVIPKEYYLSGIGWVFRQLDTPPFYNVYINKLTLKKLEKYLVGKYACDIQESLQTEPIKVGSKYKKFNGYILTKKIKGVKRYE